MTSNAKDEIGTSITSYDNHLLKELELLINLHLYYKNVPPTWGYCTVHPSKSTLNEIPAVVQTTTSFFFSPVME